MEMLKFMIGNFRIWVVSIKAEIDRFLTSTGVRGYRDKAGEWG